MPSVKPSQIRRSFLFIFALNLLFFPSSKIFAHEISGYVAGEIRLFPNDALHSGQNEQSSSFFVQPEYYHEFETGSSFTFVPFFRSIAVIRNAHILMYVNSLTYGSKKISN